MIHRDLGIATVHDVIHERSIKHSTKLKSHSNPLLQTLPLDPHTPNEDRKEGGLLTCNTMFEFSLLEGPHHVSSLQVRLPASPLLNRIFCTMIADYNK